MSIARSAWQPTSPASPHGARHGGVRLQHPRCAMQPALPAASRRRCGGCGWYGSAATEPAQCDIIDTAIHYVRCFRRRSLASRSGSPLNYVGGSTTQQIFGGYMNNRSSTWPSLAVGSLTAAVALMVGLSPASAQAPAPAAPLSGAGSFPLSFIVPGTSTSLHVGGFVQLDMNYDMSAFGNASSPGAHDNLAPESVELDGNGFGAPPPGHHDHGTFRATAQNTRFYVETRTPSSYGEIKTYIEVDFAGSNSTAGALGSTATSVGAAQTNFNQTSLTRLKQAYGTLGPFLFGMANSNYADLASLPDQLDGFVEAGGFMGAGQAKVEQARYTYLLPMGITAAVSIESNQTGGIVGTSTGANPLLPIVAGVPGVSTGLGAPAPTFNNFNAPGISQEFPAFTTTVQI